MYCCCLDSVVFPRSACFVFSFSSYHVIGVSDLVDLWVIKIKKAMILCARSTSRSSEQSTKHRSHSKNMRKVYYIVKITRCSDYQTWQTHFLRNSEVAQRYVVFFLDWAFRTLIGWADKLRSHGFHVPLPFAMSIYM